MLDTRYAIETPEGIDLALRPAGPVARILAYLIDFLIRAAILLGLAFALAVGGELGAGMMAIAYFLLEWFYPVVFEVYRAGMTPGKRSMGLRVVNDDGTPVGWSSSLVRNLLRAADFFPLLYVGGVMSMLISTNFKRLGDLAAGTLVVYNTQAKSVDVLPYPGVKPIPFRLYPQEQRALLDFSESKQRLSPQRQVELANLLSDITTHKGDQSVAELARYANGLAGRE